MLLIGEIASAMSNELRESDLEVAWRLQLDATMDGAGQVIGDLMRAPQQSPRCWSPWEKTQVGADWTADPVVAPLSGTQSAVACQRSKPK
jgi:hypothetical protein